MYFFFYKRYLVVVGFFVFILLTLASVRCSALFFLSVYSPRAVPSPYPATETYNDLHVVVPGIRTGREAYNIIFPEMHTWFTNIRHDMIALRETIEIMKTMLEKTVDRST